MIVKKLARLKMREVQRLGSGSPAGNRTRINGLGNRDSIH